MNRLHSFNSGFSLENQFPIRQIEGVSKPSLYVCIGKNLENLIKKVKRVLMSIWIFLTAPLSLRAGQAKPLLSRKPVWKQTTVDKAPLSEGVANGFEINQAMLQAVPKPIFIEHLRQIGAGISPEEILDEFDQLFKELENNEILITDIDYQIPRTVAECRQKLEDDLVRFCVIKKREDTLYQQLVKTEIDLYLRGFCFELREASPAKKKEAFKTLLHAAFHCTETRHEACRSAYETIFKQIGALEDLLLRYVQRVKEELFLQFYDACDESVHLLNHIRSRLGAELGLDRSVIKLGDINIDLFRPYYYENGIQKSDGSIANVKKRFHQLYTPSNLIFQMKYLLNDRIARDPSFATMVAQFIGLKINRKIDAGILSPEYASSFPKPYLHDESEKEIAYQLTDIGVRFLLVEHRFLKTDFPNSHCVMVEEPQI